jgi:hypothetical protein
LLLADGSVLVAGSNPNVDVNATTYFPTEYRAEIFYPPYFEATTRPAPTGMPTNISYGGDPFDITIPPTSYSGSSNNAADNTTVVLLRGGFTTHAMNMGQRYMQLNNTYTVQSDGTIILHCAQAYPSPNLLQPGPALLFVTINGIPSNGTMLIVGNGQIGQQPVSAASTLPPSVRDDSASGSANGSNTSSGSGSGSGSGNSNDSTGSTSNTGTIIGAVVGGIAAIGALGVLIGVVIARRRRAAAAAAESPQYPMTTSVQGLAAGGRGTDTNTFEPLQNANAWGASTASLRDPYRDFDDVGTRGGGTGMSIDDPYSRPPMVPVHQY